MLICLSLLQMCWIAWFSGLLFRVCHAMKPSRMLSPGLVLHSGNTPPNQPTITYQEGAPNSRSVMVFGKAMRHPGARTLCGVP
jgi:hypothetical protein